MTERYAAELEEKPRGFRVLPRRWVVERTFAWLGKARRLAKDYERLPETLAGMHWVPACLLALGLRPRHFARRGAS